MAESKELAGKLKVLGHPLRLRIVVLLAREEGEMYLNEIADSLRINRALAKIHLKLEDAGIVKSRVVLIEGEAKALRYYKLQDFDICISSKLFREGEK
ncbi:MAG: ArsR family transcriptional regulator [Thermoproteota archaeon]